jgi:hypothetical protein
MWRLQDGLRFGGAFKVEAVQECKSVSYRKFYDDMNIYGSLSGELGPSPKPPEPRSVIPEP